LDEGERGLGWAKIGLGKARLEGERARVMVGCLGVRVRWWEQGKRVGIKNDFLLYHPVTVSC